MAESRQRRTRAGLGLALLAAALVTAACAEIPTSGPVVAGEPVRQASPDPYVRIDVAPPQRGADQLGIVKGFVEAMTSYKPTYPEARLFLTPAAASAWEPAESITVHVGAIPTIEAVDATHVKVSYTVSGTVGADGSYTAATPGETQEFVVETEQVDGEWRITDPPPGVVMSEFHFFREFEAHNLYFFDPTYTVLVPDPVYIPRNGQPATLLAQALLRGPSEWLAPAVRTAFPEGTALSVRGVPVKDDTARVELTDQPSVAPVEQRERMAAQLAWTLAGVPQISGVDVTAGDIPLYGDATLTPESELRRYDPAVLPRQSALYALSPDGVVTIESDGGATPVPGPLGELPGLREVAVNTGGNRAVVVDASGAEVLVGTFGDDESIQPIATGGEFSSLSWDRTGLIWAVDHAGDGGQIVALKPDGQVVPVTADELAGHDVEKVSVSLDGTRIAAVIDGVAHVGTVVRDPGTGDDVAISGLRRVGPDAQTLDVAWVDPDKLAVLVRAPEQDPQPYVVGLSGAVSAQRGTVPGAVGVAAAPGYRLVVVTADDAMLAQDSAAQWRQFGTGHAPAYPG